MTTINRAVVEQALEALEDAKALLNNKDRTTTMWFADEITALRAALAQQAEPVEEPDTCTWQQDGDSDSGVYGTSCGGYFNIEDGTPEDNRMAWCCYCGKKLAQELLTEEGGNG